MKKTLIFVSICLLFLVVVLAQKNNTKKQQTEASTLRLKIQAAYSLEVGCGTIFDCKADEVMEGSMNIDKLFTLVVIDEKYVKLLSDNKICEILFKKYNEQEKENRFPMNGFVDENKITWEIVRIKGKMIKPNK